MVMSAEREGKKLLEIALKMPIKGKMDLNNKRNPLEGFPFLQQVAVRRTCISSF